MSRTIPPPPASLELSPLPTLSTDAAVAWLAEHGVDVTGTYLTNARRHGQLHASIIAGKRRYSTQAIWDFIVTRPTATKRGPKP